MRIAFYAPMKPPDHPVPSGDRQMARLLMRALSHGGFDVEVASQLRSYVREPHAESLERSADLERQRLIGLWTAAPARHRLHLWFTYHPYYKAPDLIGPQIASHLSIPYVTAEASHAGKRDRDAWAGLQAHVARAVRSAALNICFTTTDREGLEPIAAPDRIAELAPFIDPHPFLTALPAAAAHGPVRLVTVAMMRPGVKFASYRMLARALARIADAPWTLEVIGDGPERANVAGAFSDLPAGRVLWAGQGSAEAVAQALGAADVFVWPGTGEAYGIAYLEAQAAGLPVVAQATAGVPAVVRHGVTGLLSEPGDDEAFAAAMARLIGDAGLRRRLGTAARQFVVAERSLDAAAVALRRLIEPLLTTAPA